MRLHRPFASISLHGAFNGLLLFLYLVVLCTITEAYFRLFNNALLNGSNYASRYL